MTRNKVAKPYKALALFLLMQITLIGIAARSKLYITSPSHCHTTEGYCRSFVRLDQGATLVRVHSHFHGEAITSDYLLIADTVYMENHSQSHQRGPIVFQNPGDYGKSPLNGISEKTNHVNARLTYSQGKTRFRGFYGEIVSLGQ